MENVVLVGVDGSPESRGAASWALHEATARQWLILFAHAFPKPTIADPAVDAAYVRASHRTAQLIFEELEAEAKARDIQVRSIAIPGRADEVLAKLSNDAGLNVVGRRSHSGFSARLSSVSSALAAHDHSETDDGSGGHDHANRSGCHFHLSRPSGVLCATATRPLGELLNVHWELDRTFATFLPPEQDLLKKTRSGAKIAKIHDKPATPHRRAITDPAAGKMPASRMSAPFKKNRAMTISRQILALTGQLRTLAKAKGGTAHDRHSEVLS